MDEMIAELQELVALAQEHERPKFKVLPDRWIARSAFQKYMRRGQVEEAMIAGMNLLHAAPPAMWRALGTIIVEDIGITDLDLLAYSTMCGLVTLQKKAGIKPIDLLWAMVRRACLVPVKTRSACELSLGAYKNPQVNWDAWHNSTDDHLMSVLFGTSGTVDMYAAAHVLKARVRKQGTAMQNRVLSAMMERLGRGSAGRAAMLCFERPVDDMNLTVFPLLANDYLTGEGQPEELLEGPDIVGVLPAAYDMHTQTGKRAIKAFSTSLANKGNQTMRQFNTASSNIVKGLGSVIFIVEGGQVAPQRLWSDRHAKLKEFQDRNFSAVYGCPADMHDDMMQLVLDNFDVLQEKRLWAATTA